MKYILGKKPEAMKIKSINDARIICTNSFEIPTKVAIVETGNLIFVTKWLYERIELVP